MHAHLDRVAELERSSTPAADESGSQFVQLKVVALEPSRRKIALEDVAEADEEPRADRAGDLSVERGLPAAFEKVPLEEPGEADLVGPVLDLGRNALALGGVLRELLQVVRLRFVGDAQLA